MTTRGFKEKEFVKVAKIIDDALRHIEDEKYLKTLEKQVKELTKQFPLWY